MNSTSALIFESQIPVMVGGLTTAERASAVAARTGFSPVRIVSSDVARVGRRQSGRSGLAVRVDSATPFRSISPDERAVVIAADVLVDAPTLTRLVAEAEDEKTRASVVSAAGMPALLFLPAGQAAAIERSTSIQEAAAQLAARGTLLERSLSPGSFCRRVNDSTTAKRAELDLVRHLNGSKESFFTKIIRRFSVPLSVRLARLGVTPTFVTASGLVLATLSAACISTGSYGIAVLGALLYYASMIFDCSDGEVARLTVRESSFGAWLETAVDYTTYFLLLGALVWAQRGDPAGELYRVVALIALAGSVTVALVAIFLRKRVAGADPGQFDDSSAEALASASAMHRFARWGRQWIKRSSVAHLVVALALIGQLPLLIYLWAFGAVVASVVILTVAPFVVRRVAVKPLDVRDTHARG